MRAGQGDRQFDLDEGGRGRLPRPGAAVPRLRRGDRGDGLRRAGPGRHRGAQDRDHQARLRHPRRRGRLPAGGHRLRSQRLRGRHRHRGARQLRRRLHRRDARHPDRPAARPRLRRHLEPVLLVSRQRAGARGDAHGVPLPRHPGGHGHGHRQCRPARRLRQARPGAARAERGRRPQPPLRRHRAPARGGLALQGRRVRRGPGAGSRMAWLGGRKATRARPRQRHHRLHRRRRRGGAPDRGAPAPRHRGPAYGRHERGRRPVRRR